jgi:hypothetical protein
MRTKSRDITRHTKRSLSSVKPSLGRRAALTSSPTTFYRSRPLTRAAIHRGRHTRRNGHHQTRHPQGSMRIRKEHLDASMSKPLAVTQGLHQPNIISTAALRVRDDKPPEYDGTLRPLRSNDGSDEQREGVGILEEWEDSGYSSTCPVASSATFAIRLLNPQHQLNSHSHAPNPSHPPHPMRYRHLGQSRSSKLDATVGMRLEVGVAVTRGRMLPLHGWWLPLRLTLPSILTMGRLRSRCRNGDGGVHVDGEWKEKEWSI